MEVKLTDDKGATTSKWINFEDWKYLKTWRHYAGLKALNFSPCNPPTDEDIERFKEVYKETYPDNAKFLNL